MRIISWNVNGIRAAAKKGLLEYIQADAPDILCLQETKAHREQLDEKLTDIEGYTAYFCSGERKGYSGVATYTKPEPLGVRRGLDQDAAFDAEGRILIHEYDEFFLYNIYFPNGRGSAERLDYKMRFYDAFLAHMDQTRADTGKHIIVCGDYNTAHKEIDLSRPKENAKTSGFLPQERAWMDKLVQHGYVDTFRQFNPNPQEYSWWDTITRARERNVGWRLDYFFVDEAALPRVKDAFILQQVMGSDHCPVGIIWE